MTRVSLFSPPRPPAAPQSSRPPLPPVEAVRGGKAVAADVVRLIELQWKLLVADGKAAASRAILAAALVVGGAVLALSALPIALVALAFLFIAAGLPGWGAFLLAALAGAAVGGLLAYLGARRLGTAAGTFARSRDALARNAAWVKRSLAREPHDADPTSVPPPPNRRPPSATPR